jgi:hypothetical protein
MDPRLRGDDEKISVKTVPIVELLRILHQREKG